jgi:threonine dehydrogenase-like Zn-dependent dehydrogenase
MLAAVTEGVGSIALRERPAAPTPLAGDVVVAPEAIGICGSDYHLFLGELSDAAGGSRFPRVQGHEVAGTITALGPGCRAELALGQRVALWPLHACGECYPCRIGRHTTCDNFKLIGIHVDGGLQESLTIGQSHAFPINVGEASVAAMAEPVSIAVRAVNRGRVSAGERVVILGAGPIGQCVCLLARERGAEVMVIDVQARRLALCREMGAETLVWSSADSVLEPVRRWAGPAGPPVVFDATGAASAVQAMLEMVSSAGRAVQVGMSEQLVPIRVGLLTEKELDLLGVSCCGADEFAEAVEVVERNAGVLGQLISHEFSLRQAPEAMRFALENPGEVMKVVIRGG